MFCNGRTAAGSFRNIASPAHRGSLDVCLQRDQSIFQLLTDACWPDRAAAAYSSLMDMGVDALDALAAAAHSSCASSMLVGVAYHARVALHYVVGETCAQQLKQLLQQRGEEENMGVAAASNDVLVALDGALLLVSDATRTVCCSGAYVL